MLFKVTFHETGRVEELEAPEDIRAGDSVSLKVDGNENLYNVMTVSGTIIGGECTPAMIRVSRS